MSFLEIVHNTSHVVALLGWQTFLYEVTSHWMALFTLAIVVIVAYWLRDDFYAGIECDEDQCEVAPTVSNALTVNENQGQPAAKATSLTTSQADPRLRMMYQPVSTAKMRAQLRKSA